MYIKDDLPTDIARQRQDLRCLAALARDKGYGAAVRDGVLIVDNKRYTYKDLDNLPDDLTIKNAKTLKVDNDGLAFQSHHSYLSSMYPCSIIHDGHSHNSAEHVLLVRHSQTRREQVRNGAGARCQNRLRSETNRWKIKANPRNLSSKRNKLW